MVHRGPDDAGEWWSRDFRIGLAHRRLSIFDLSSAGHQPMCGESDRLTIVFNGEIYNFKSLRKELIDAGYNFRSSTDTEVILAAYDKWGYSCLSKLEGMFAFAIFDSVRQELFLARDRAGEKPLFISNKNGQLRFASELKAILEDKTQSVELDFVSLEYYLNTGHIAGERCVFKDFNKLPPAHCMTFDCQTGSSSIWRYWNLDDYQYKGTGSVYSEQEIVGELAALLEQAVDRQLVADVPVGVLLSGGVDSSLLTALACRRGKKVKTFTVGFPGNAGHDESEHARLVADYFETEHYELGASEIKPELLEQLVYHYDEPMTDSSMLPTYLVSNLVKDYCTVALGGDGGDELFGGYPHYNRLLKLEKVQNKIPRVLQNMASNVARNFLPVGVFSSNIRTWMMCLAQGQDAGLPHCTVFFDKKYRERLLGGNVCGAEVEALRAHRVPSQSSLLQRATRFDFSNYLAEDILVKIDRASMASSLELRAPFLDKSVIEFAYSNVPEQLKVTGEGRKIILRKLTERYLPTEFDSKRKQGFSIPLGEWLKNGEWREFFESVLYDEGCLFNQKTVRSLLESQDRGRKNEERLFNLVVFELWRKRFGVVV